MEKSSNQTENIIDYQAVEVKKKLEKIFNYDSLVPIETCPIRDVLSVASDKWSILIVLFLGGHEVLRFGDLKSLIHGISAKVLTERLRTLEKDGYLSRQVFPEVPLRVEYKLTAFGLRYLEKLLVISEWISEEMDYVIQSRFRYDNNKT
ncbi:winged helix-turn-helix transcriptional regulator [Aquiflexum lacus]|uniref:winged helix-turn-helix transcriptional regulator n=1 Tax=Aquiflexum lacus TaxID=2483805 RepID=UPI001893FC72|nr:helix-turn-helix domain-containing protein [Aquiflexum lacus]